MYIFQKVIFTLVLFGFSSWSNATPAKKETVQKYFELFHSKEEFEKRYQIKDAYYDNMATNRVLYHINAPRIDPDLLTQKQKLVAQKIAKIMKAYDSDFLTPEQQYDKQMDSYLKNYSEESIQYFIDHAQSEAEQNLILKNQAVSLYFTSMMPDILPRYLERTDFTPIVFRDILKLIPENNAQEPSKQ